MAEVFYILYCLVKNTLPPKVFFKFFKDLYLFFIYPKTAPNDSGSVYIFLTFLNFIVPDGPQEETDREYRAGTEVLTKYVVKSMNLSNLLQIW